MDEELQRRLEQLQADGRKSWDKKIARLEAELRRLPIQKQTVPGKSYAETIPETARELLSLAWHKRAAAAGERRRLAASVGQTLRALAPLTHDDLGYARSELARLRLDLLKLHVAARRGSFKGAPKKVDVEKLTRTVAFHYRRLTGSRPTIKFAKNGTAGGPWLEHLRAVFAIVGVGSAKAHPGSRKRRAS